MQVEIDEETYEILQRIKQTYRILKRKETTETQILRYLVFNFVEEFLVPIDQIESR